jgi:hypothetical protein
MVTNSVGKDAVLGDIAMKRVPVVKVTRYDGYEPAMRRFAA